MTVLLALMSSALWGAADFLGGRAARTAPVLTVLAWVQGTGLLFIAIVVLVAAPEISAEGVAWGLLAGLVGAAAIGALYAALAAGAMSLVSPLAACGAIVPAAVAIVGGEVLSAPVAVGLVLALGGAVVVARTPGGSDVASAMTLSRRALVLSVAAAVLIGVLMALLQHASEIEGSSALAAVLAIRAAALTCTLVAIRLRRGTLRLDRPARGPLVAAGVGDTSANALFAIATTKGSDAVAAILGSLYPVTTVALAAVVLRERVAPVQAVGIVVALAGVVLVSAG